MDPLSSRFVIGWGKEIDDHSDRGNCSERQREATSGHFRPSHMAYQDWLL